MKLDVDLLVAPLVALLLLALIVEQTLGALRGGGAWGRRHTATAQADNPYAMLDRMLARADTSSVPVRDPFAFAKPSGPAVAVRHTAPSHEATPQGPPPPLLTAIVFDADPRATIRYNGVDYSVRVSSLFADFRVVSIARDQVVLDRSGESLVLRLPAKGD